MVKYQGALLEDPRLTIRMIQAISPVSLLPSSLEAPEDGCTEVTVKGCFELSQLYQDTRIQDPDLTLFSDGSSMVTDGVQKSGAAVTTLHQMVRSDHCLPGPQCSGQS